ncbi:hypothetical protein SAMN04489740_2717 [Arthrobacter alpinus]|uniref:Uncharacterized protein n=1 Tax=Arthrobacter alpinus TaxID=656366 RepID=A0A1H5M4G4_9MICC|nr:hypothetical protein [Arthrobacter alpinus]SEE83388.1 hypothetical protein SAMN04489740_2717 [Arthrobacter alpinus]
MKYETAVEAIKAILAAVPDDELPKPSKIKKSAEGTPVVWFGGRGYHLGSATSSRNGGEKKRNPLNYRNHAVYDALIGETVTRLDLDYNPEAAK